MSETETSRRLSLSLRRWVGPVAAVAVAMLLVACGSSSSDSTQSGSGGSAKSKVRITYFQQAAPQAEQIIATEPSLKKMVPANIDWLPITNGPVALAGLESNSYDIVAETGNPPIVGAVAKGIPFKIIWDASHDDAGLVVQPSIKTVAEMKGKTFATPQGSSEDYAFEGWLKENGLLGKVNLVNIPDRQAMAASFTSGRVDGAFEDDPQLSELQSKGGRLVTTESQISQRYPQYSTANTVSVSDSFAKAHPAVVQGYICAVLQATKLALGSGKDTAFKNAANFLGLSTKEAVASGRTWPVVPPGQELALLKSSSGGLSPLAETLVNTSKYLADTQAIPKPISNATATSYIDSSYAEKALAGKCS